MIRILSLHLLGNSFSRSQRFGESPYGTVRVAIFPPRMVPLEILSYKHAFSSMQSFTDADVLLAGFRRQMEQKDFKIEDYSTNCVRVLTDLRRATRDWKATRSHNMAFRLSTYNLPKLSRAITKLSGYNGCKIVRKDCSLPSAFWEVEKYKFL